jgi:hypothetical protein
MTMARIARDFRAVRHEHFCSEEGKCAKRLGLRRLDAALE